MSTIQPRTFDHVGLTVSDIMQAVVFYTKALGFFLIMEPTELKPDSTTAMGKMLADVFGPRFKSANIAHMASANGVGLELFQFIDPQTQKPSDNFTYETIGLTHFNVLDPDIEKLAARVVEHGGKQRSEVHAWDAELPFRMVYLEDPFGNIFEGYSHPYMQIYSTLAARQGVRPAR